MLKTPPKLAGLGIALTTCAIGAAGSLNAGQMAEQPEHEMTIEFDGPEFDVLQIEYTPSGPEVTELPEVAVQPGWNC